MKKLPRIKLRRIKLPKWNYKKIALWASSFALLLLIVSSYLAYTKLYLTDERRFWIAIENNLSTRSMVKQVTGGGTGNRTIEKTRFNFGTEATMDRVTSISAKTATTESNVTTRTITTPTDQYVSYLNIFTNEKKQSGDLYDFGSLKGLWAKQAEATPETADAMRLSYIQSNITIVPYGNLSASARKSIIKELKDENIYMFDFNNTKIQEVDGKKYIGLYAKVKLKKYVTVLQKNFDLMGYGAYPPLDPSQYDDTDLYEARFLINPTNNNMYGISAGNQIEIYTNFGVIQNAPIPKDTITMDALQEKLQDLQ